MSAPAPAFRVVEPLRLGLDEVCDCAPDMAGAELVHEAGCSVERAVVCTGCGLRWLVEEHGLICPECDELAAPVVVRPVTPLEVEEPAA